MSAVKSILKVLAPQKLRRQVREQLASVRMSHLHGPKTVQLGENEAAVTCVVRNGEFYLERFLDHYVRCGFRHFVFLDNGSSDRTIEIAASRPNVTVYQSALPIEAHQAIFKRLLPRKSVQGGWCLDADIDEFFDYPFSDFVPLPSFLAYLNRHGYTVVMTQLLDMFAGQLRDNDLTGPLDEHYPYYDLSEVRRTSYRSSELAVYGNRNSLPDPEPQLLWGGIRRTLSGNDYLLTKHSLFSMRHDADIFPHVHFVNNASLADVSGVLLHYKLTSTAIAIALQNLEKFPGNAKLYADFIQFLKTPGYQIKRPTATHLGHTNELVDCAFLFASERYRTLSRAAENRRPVSQ